MEAFFQYLSSLAELQAAIVTRTIKKSFQARRTLLSTGEVCSWLAFVEQGLVKVA